MREALLQRASACPFSDLNQTRGIKSLTGPLTVNVTFVKLAFSVKIKALAFDSLTTLRSLMVALVSKRIPT